MKDRIEKQAKKIIDNFVKELGKVKVEESRVEREEDRRKELEEIKVEEGNDFRKGMFKNAQKTKNDYIKAEKGKWAK